VKAVRRLKAALDSYLGTQLSPHKVRSETDGSLICRAVICRSGFQDYRLGELSPESGSNEIVSVWRPPEEVLSPEFISSCEGATLCSGHPGRFVSPENYQWVNRGFAVNVSRGPDDSDGNVTLMADLHLKDAAIEQEVESGKKQLSVGYIYQLSDENGRLTMRGLKTNHIAIVETARAGDVAQITDSADGFIRSNNEESPIFDPRRKQENVDEDLIEDEPAMSGLSKGVGKAASGIGGGVGGLAEGAGEGAGEAIHGAGEAVRGIGHAIKRVAFAGEDEIETGEESDMDQAKFSARLDAQDKILERLCGLMERIAGKPAKDECNCGGKKIHADTCPKFEAQAEDMDENLSDRRQKPDEFGLRVIPVNGKGEEGNVNPVTAHDYQEALNNLRGIRSIVAKSRDTAAIRAYNRAVTDVKRRLQDALMNPPIVGPQHLAADEVRDRVRADGADYESMCRALHRQAIPNVGADDSDYIEKSRKREARDGKPKAESYEEQILRARKKALAN